MLVEFKDETIFLNWDDIIEDSIRLDIELRDKIFQELQNTFSENIVTQTTLYKMNEYVVNRLKEIKHDLLHDRASNKKS